ncbi:MAG TPA: molybdopterin cofactor-binding domain-containing protein [Burkholderiales bacterium]|nr:molybdopterin cofactor-binding domain-containing protein [Burkholderiales bacterium]
MKPEFEGIAFQSISRRAFLISSGAAAVAIAFGSFSKRILAQVEPFSPNGWVRVGTDNIVTVYSPACEMGQGVMTAMPLLIAEEMDLDWGRVRVEQAPYNPKVFGNPLFGGNMLAGASRTTRGYYEVMRLAGMQARQIMIQNAAQKWDVPASELATEPNAVVHKASGRKLSYGEIAEFATVPASPPQFTREQLKRPSEFRLIGKDMPRIEIPDKVNGQAKYGIDVRMLGMLYGAVLRAPVNGEAPLSVDDSEARKVEGVRQIVRMPYGVGVIADTYPAALKAKKALKVEWTQRSKARAYNTDKLIPEYQQRVRNLSDTGVVYEAHGDARGAMAKAAKRVTAEYTSLNVTHATMEPMNCTARVDGDRIEFWAPTQSPFGVFLAAVKAHGFKPENVKINVTLLGGGFGRRAENDYAVDVGFLAKAVPGYPVKMIWTREDDIQFTKPRPLTVQRLEAGLDEQGNLVSFHHRIVGESIYRRFAPPAFQASGGKDLPLCEGAYEPTYHYPNFALEQLLEERGVDVAVWRSVGGGYTKFAIETFIEEVAAAAGKDPIDFRMQLLAKQPRGQAVLREVMAMSDWSRPRPAARALGIAYSDIWETYSAMVAEVSVDRKTGKVNVHEVWSAVDTGVALQPRNVRAQIESSVVFGLSALREKLVYKDGVAQQSNFHDYPVLRMNEVPKITTRVTVTDNKPGGIGEVGLPPVAPAVANAVFKLTGKRLRDLPFDQNLLKA